MDQQAKRTTGPWHAREWNTRAATTIAVLDPNSNVTGVHVIAECDTAENAARIVQCVNAHDELRWIVNGFLEWHEGSHCPEGLIERARAALSTDAASSLPALAKHQPCGCVVCTCEDQEQCHGCGAKYCGQHAALALSA